MFNSARTFVLIDGNSLLHRCFHALPPFRTQSGELVNAVYGFTSVLLSILDREKPAYVAIAFDKKGPTFRHELYKEYKATRVKAPDELYGQIPRIREIIEAFGIPIFEHDFVEADDVIGTIAHRLDEYKEINTLIVTGDLDALQLVNEHTCLAITKSGFSKVEFIDQHEIEKRYGLNASQMVDYKALVGDPSDNIRGVQGIGPKTAIDLLQQYDTLENIYERLENIPAATREKLIHYKNDAFLSQKLVNIVRDVPLTFDITICKIYPIDIARVKKVFQELEFKRLIDRLEKVFGSGAEKLTGKHKKKDGVHNQQLEKSKHTQKVSHERKGGDAHASSSKPVEQLSLF